MADRPGMSSSTSLLWRAQKYLVFAAAIYLALLAFLTIPSIQKHVIFMHSVRWPLFTNFSSPSSYGLPAQRSANVYIKTPDKEQLGAWLVLAEDYPGHHMIPHEPPLATAVDASLSLRPTMLFLHGNTGTRAFPFRVQHYLDYSSSLKANVLAIDYRGFGDSTGSPSEAGLNIDAKAAWDWLTTHGALPQSILIVGHSLGTGVASALAENLARKNIVPRGVVLLAPFSSVEELLDNYSFFGIFPPLFQPLQPFPQIKRFIYKFLQTRFETRNCLPAINAPILIAHSENDYDIPSSHSRNLFDNLLEPLLPSAPVPPTSISDLSGYNWDHFNSALEERRLMRASLVSTRNLDFIGEVLSFDRPHGEKSSAVVFIHTKLGGHDKIGIERAVIQLLGETFNLAVSG